MKNLDPTMRILTRLYRDKAPSAKENPFHSLIFTLLSARTRDSQTEIVWKKLIDRYPTPERLARAKPETVLSLLRTIGLYRAKAKNVIALARLLVLNYGGKVPSNIEALIELPGVGRKTANCVMVYAFGKPAVCVDTHVHRIVNRLGWVRTKTPEQTEVALRKILPKRWWMKVNFTMVQFGRDLCVPGRPKCWKCPVRAYCRYPNKTPTPFVR